MEKLLNINRYLMYLLLALAVSIPFFLPSSCTIIPTLTKTSTQDLYINLMQLPEGSTVLIESDWTVSTRGESAGQFEAFLKIARFRNLKFVLLSGGDAQAPQVALNSIARLNSQFKAAGLPELKPWDDYVALGLFTDPASMWQSVTTNFRQAFASKTAFDPAAGQQRSVYESPVLKNIKTSKDLGMVVIVTASASLDIMVQRMSGKGTKIGQMVTGVMAPESLIYYNSGQVAGQSGGLRGVVEMETMMSRGVNYSADGKEPFVKAPQFSGKIAPLPESLKPLDRGMSYFASLHAALILMIAAVVLGNVGLLMQKKKGGAK
ncbi:MAG: hypothetical protein IT205_06755 [Fimbriimonadaceae bacterium]|nr:hypothetical protein [Fimbriimonadaceae bacterium]